MKELYYWVSLSLMLCRNIQAMPENIRIAQQAVKALEIHIKEAKSQFDEFNMNPEENKELISGLFRKLKAYLRLLEKRRESLIYNVAIFAVREIKNFNRILAASPGEFTSSKLEQMKEICSEVIKRVPEKITTTSQMTEKNSFKALYNTARRSMELIEWAMDYGDLHLIRKRPRTEEILPDIVA